MGELTDKRRAMSPREADEALPPPPTHRGRRTFPSIPDTIPPPPKPAIDERDEWLELVSRMAYRRATEADERAEKAVQAAERIEKVIGVEPQPAQNIEGSGLLRVLSGHVRDKEADERRKRDLRILFAGLLAGLTLLATALGVLKAVGVLH